MESLGFNIWGIIPPFNSQRPRRKRRNPSSKSNSSVESTGGPGFRFPMKQAVTAGILAVTGDTLAQLRERWLIHNSSSHHFKVTLFISCFFIILGVTLYIFYVFVAFCCCRYVHLCLQCIWDFFVWWIFDKCWYPRFYEAYADNDCYLYMWFET